MKLAIWACGHVAPLEARTLHLLESIFEPRGNANAFGVSLSVLPCLEAEKFLCVEADSNVRFANQFMTNV